MVIASHTIDISCKGGIVTTNEDISPRCNPLVKHTEEVGVDRPKIGLKIVKKVNFVMFLQNGKETLVAFIRCDVDGFSIGEYILHIVVYDTGGNSGIFVLKITTANMKALVTAIRATIFSGFSADFFDNASCSTLDLVDIL